VPSRRSRLPRLSLLARFALASFLLVVVLGVLLGFELQKAVRNEAMDNAARTARVAADVGLRPSLRVSDLKTGTQPLPPERIDTIDQDLHPAMSSGTVLRLKVWNRDHQVVYSDNASLIGRQFPGADLDEVFDTGKASAEISQPTAAENVAEQGFGELLSVYVPLYADTGGSLAVTASGPVIGVFEIYQSYAPVQAFITRETRRLFAWLAVGLLTLFLGLFRIVASASRRIRNQSLDHLHQARHDALTGLVNRAELRRLLEVAIAAAHKERSGLALVVLDLDRFKEINDTLGHHNGDQVVQELARRFQEGFRGTDTAARLGGDEFAVLLPGVSDPLQLQTVLGVVHDILSDPIVVDGLELEMHGSVGVALYPEHGEDADTLLRRADVAMYEAKRTYARTVVYKPEIDRYSPKRLRLVSEVRRAVEEGELTLVYQPKLDVRAGRIDGVEALVRWNHPQRGPIPPMEFLPALENTEQMHLLTHHVLDLAVAQCARWHRQELPLSVAVNLSARDLADPSLCAYLVELLDRHRLPADALEVELTETAVLIDPEQARRALLQIHDRGIRVAIDDFGTGYASLAYVSSLPVDTLKIDGSFVKAMTTDDRALAIVQFTLGLGSMLGYDVVAEGVEDGPTFSRLTQLGCRHIQGYRVARPLPPLELEHFLNSIGRPVPLPEAS
jgi:diguanylate cyclase (GGDEF)-like protein